MICSAEVAPAITEAQPGAALTAAPPAMRLTNRIGAEILSQWLTAAGSSSRPDEFDNSQPLKSPAESGEFLFAARRVPAVRGLAAGGGPAARAPYEVVHAQTHVAWVDSS